MEDNKDTKNVVEENQNIDESQENHQVESNEKTYSEDNIQNSFNAGLKKGSNKFKSDPEYKEFLKWKKNNQTDLEKMNNLTTENNKKDEKIKSLETQIEVLNSGAKKEFVRFVTSEIKNLIDEDDDIKSVLKNYKKENPQYFGEVVIRKTKSSPSLNGGDNKDSTTNDIMNEILRNSRN